MGMFFLVIYLLSVIFIFRKIFFDENYKRIISDIHNESKVLQVLHYTYLVIISLVPILNFIVLYIVKYVYTGRLEK